MGTATTRKAYPRQRKRDDPPVKPPQVNDLVDIWWDEDQCFYSGTLARRHDGNNMFRIEYDDGDMEDIDLSNEFWRYSKTQLSQQQTTNNDSTIEEVVVDGSDPPPAPSPHPSRTKSRTRGQNSSRRIADKRPPDTSVEAPNVPGHDTPDAHIDQKSLSSVPRKENATREKERKKEVYPATPRQSKPSTKLVLQQKEPNTRTKAKNVKSRKAAADALASSTPIAKQKSPASSSNNSDVLFHSHPHRTSRPSQSDNTDEQKGTADHSDFAKQADRVTPSVHHEHIGAAQKNSDPASLTKGETNKVTSSSSNPRSPGVGETRAGVASSAPVLSTDAELNHPKLKYARVKFKRTRSKSSKSVESLESEQKTLLQSTRSKQPSNEVNQYQGNQDAIIAPVAVVPSSIMLEEVKQPLLSPDQHPTVGCSDRGKEVVPSSTQQPDPNRCLEKIDMTTAALPSPAIEKKAEESVLPTTIPISSSNSSAPTKTQEKAPDFDSNACMHPAHVANDAKFSQASSAAAAPAECSLVPAKSVRPFQLPSGLDDKADVVKLGPTSTEQNTTPIPVVLRVRLNKHDQEHIWLGDKQGPETSRNLPNSKDVSPTSHGKDRTPRRAGKRSRPDVGDSDSEILEEIQSVANQGLPLAKRARIDSSNNESKDRQTDNTFERSLAAGHDELVRLLDVRLSPFEKRVEECMNDLKTMQEMQLDLVRGNEALISFSKQWESKQSASLEKLHIAIQESRMEVQDTISAKMRELELKLSEQLTDRIAGCVKTALQEFEQQVIPRSYEKCARTKEPQRTLTPDETSPVAAGIAVQEAERPIASAAQDVSRPHVLPDEVIDVDNQPGSHDGAPRRSGWRRPRNEVVSPRSAEAAAPEPLGVKDQIKHVVARQITVWLLETEHDFIPDSHTSIEQWARRKSSDAFLVVSGILGRYKSFERAYQTLSASLGNDAVELSWFLQPGCTENFHLARRNYAAWDPPPNDEEWKGELVLLKQLSEGFHNVLEQYVVKDGCPTLEAAVFVTKLAAQKLQSEANRLGSNAMISVDAPGTNTSAAQAGEWHNVITPRQPFQRYGARSGRSTGSPHRRYSR